MESERQGTSLFNQTSKKFSNSVYFEYSTIKMMHGPINIRFNIFCFLFEKARN